MHSRSHLEHINLSKRLVIRCGSAGDFVQCLLFTSDIQSFAAAILLQILRESQNFTHKFESHQLVEAEQFLHARPFSVLGQRTIYDR